MKLLLVCVCICLVDYVTSEESYNTTVDAASQQLAEFRSHHPEPSGVWTKLTGDPIDIRDTITLNSDIFNNKHNFLFTSHGIRGRTPERIVFGKGTGAFGYFEVTNDVSKYIKADMFNGIGKRTPLFGRFSTSNQNLGGNDLMRELKSISLKFYTREGNFDLICINVPVLFRDPINFISFSNIFRRNPRTRLFDYTMRWDTFTLKPEILQAFLWLHSDLGIPDGFRKMNIFPIHTYEVYNEHGDQYYVKFNFRTEIGLVNLTNAQAQSIRGDDPDYYVRDLYNSIAAKNYPTWKLEMDILTKEDLTKVDYDPFDMSRLWKRGTYRTVTVGRLVFNRREDNAFKGTELSAFNPDNLVPGIVSPADFLFKARKIFYPDTQHHRLGSNHVKEMINAPLYANTYNRDGKPPVLDNLDDAPIYYPNSFNGPMPYVDESRPTEKLFVMHTNAIDLQPMAEFYNEIIESDAHRQRLADNLAGTLEDVPGDIEKKALWILSLIDEDFGRRVSSALKQVRARAKIPKLERYNRIAQCIANQPT